MAYSATYADVERARAARDVGLLIDILDRAETPLRVAAARHLGELAPAEAEDSLRRALRSPDLILRVACIKALGAIRNSDAADAILDAVAQDQHLAVQSTAAVALLRLGDSRASDVLIRLALRDEVIARYSRRWAIRELAASGTPIDGAVVERVVAALSPLDKVRLRKEVAVLRGSG